jgi:hypothetical protein
MFGLKKNRKYQPEEAVKKRSHRNADGGRHHQTGLHCRLSMMDAMKQEGDPFSPGACWRQMEKESMEHVFRESPEYEPSQKGQENKKWAGKPGPFFQGLIGKKKDYRRPGYQNGYRGNMGKEFQEIGFKKSDRFFIVIDFDKRHRTLFLSWIDNFHR